MADLDRRNFLKILGLAGTSAACGCSAESVRTLIPYIIPAEDIIPGQATWFASTCRECPAGCGLLAKNRDGHVIKLEGNPLHPVNRGALCARGQAALHGLYNPDRFPGPMQRMEDGRLQPIAWDEAEKFLVAKLRQIRKSGGQDRVVLVTDLMTGTLHHTVDYWLAEMGSRQHLVYEPFAYEPLRRANAMVFGVDGIPAYRIDAADFLISFGAGFLETWLSNVEYARQFAAFHEPRDGHKNTFVYVGSRLSLTANNADQWIAVAPGDEYLVAVALLKIILESDAPAGLPAERRAAMRALVKDFSVPGVTASIGVKPETLHSLAQRFARAKQPLILAEGLSFAAPHATATAVAADLLCSLHPHFARTMDFSALSAYGGVNRAADFKHLGERIDHGEVDLLLFYNANPLYFLPPSWELRRSLQRVPLIVSFSAAVDETTSCAQLVLPTQTPLEAWGDYAPRTGVSGLMQPVMGNLFRTRHLGDILIRSGRQVRGKDRFPWKDFYAVLRAVWQQTGREKAPQLAAQAFWEQSVEKGGRWEPEPAAAAKLPSAKVPADYVFPAPKRSPESIQGFHLTAYPTIQFFDGRGASRPWLQELPDPLAQMTWGTWLEVNLQTARELNLHDGDLVEVRSPYGSMEVPVFPLPGVPPHTLAVPIGQGHTDYGRFAAVTEYGNPMQLLPAEIDAECGGMLRPAFRVSITKRHRRVGMAHTDGSLYQHGRELVRTLSMAEYRQGLATHAKPHLYPPLPEGYDPRRDFYPPHPHVDYRWGMVIDLDRCIGCGACVVACYAENNVAIVGKEQMLRGREMSWLRVQRYFDESQPVARHLPLPCQHCDNAPCESVCPVYAPHHSKEGLNNQVYNRCIGTRFCAQNCPYKIRRFNWFTFTRAEPLNWQLNPDVTVRQKGVMEKCSFCVQRIVAAKQRAKSLGRQVQDGDFTTACAQTCPTGAIVFGNLMDPASRVSQLMWQPRAYQVLDHLNTKPAVIYLKRLTRQMV